MSVESQTFTSEVQATITPDSAIAMLKAGNARFVEGSAAQRDLHEQVRVTSTGQHPFAVIQGCIDSRVPIETVFDLGIGDVFTSRVAGNVINVDQLGGMEYGCKAAGSKLVVIMGHTNCGAVGGAVAGIQLGNLSGLLGKIRPAMKGLGIIDQATPELVNKVVELNVRRSVERVRDESAVLQELERAGDIRIVGAIYDIATGKVRFLDDA